MLVQRPGSAHSGRRTSAHPFLPAQITLPPSLPPPCLSPSPPHLLQVLLVPGVRHHNELAALIGNGARQVVADAPVRVFGDGECEGCSRGVVLGCMGAWQPGGLGCIAGGHRLGRSQCPWSWLGPPWRAGEAPQQTEAPHHVQLPSQCCWGGLSPVQGASLGTTGSHPLLLRPLPPLLVQPTHATRASQGWLHPHTWRRRSAAPSCSPERAPCFKKMVAEAGKGGAYKRRRWVREAWGAGREIGQFPLRRPHSARLPASPTPDSWHVGVLVPSDVSRACLWHLLMKHIAVGRPGRAVAQTRSGLRSPGPPVPH